MPKAKSPRKKSPPKSPKKESLTIGQLTSQKKRLLMDCLMCLAFINFEWKEWEVSKNFFNHAYLVAMYLKEVQLANLCLCCQGMAVASQNLETLQKVADPSQH